MAPSIVDVVSPRVVEEGSSARRAFWRSRYEGSPEL